MENKEILANKAMEIINTTIENRGSISDTQIRNFVEAAKKSTNYSELKIFMKYQSVRMKPIKPFIDASLKYLDSEYSKIKDFLARKEEIAYLFGLMARYKKVKDEEMREGGRR